MRQRYSISRAASIILAVPAVLFLATSCAQKKGDAWVSPADDSSLARLEAATLERNVPNSRRARLFFLWGQELADKGEEEKAIGAFERVVDLRSDLVDESRFNLEILWRRQAERKQQDQQGQPDKQNSQDNRSQQNAGDKSNGDQKSGDQKKTDGKQGQQDKQNSAGKSSDTAADNSAAKGSQSAQQKDAAAKQNQSAPKDLSALVRDKAQSSDLDRALKAELERRNEKQKAESGGIAPVEKDW